MSSPRFLRDADVVIYMKEGRVHSCGPPSEVLPLVEDQEEATDQEGAAGQGAGLQSLSSSIVESSATVSIYHVASRYPCSGGFGNFKQSSGLNWKL